MTSFPSKWAWIGVFAAFAILPFLSFQDRPGKDREASDLARRWMVHHYLAIYKESDTPFKSLDKILTTYWERYEKPVLLGEAIALIYGLEGKEELARNMIAEIEALGGDMTALKYAFAYEDDLPETWTPVSNDWVAAKISSMICRRQDSECEAQSIISLRHFESEARRKSNFEFWRYLLYMFGMVQLMLMWFSARHWRRLGEEFFALKPLSLKPRALSNFLLLYLAGHLLLAFPAAMLAKAMDPLLARSLIYLVQVVWAIYLLRIYVFPGQNASEQLEINNLTMRIRYIPSILGGLAIIAFLQELAAILAATIHWAIPLDTVSGKAFMEQPISGGLFIIIACILGPVFEEVIFRGLIFRNLLGRFSARRAIIFSALIFALLHPFPTWPQLFFAGMGLAIIYYRTGNLIITIGAHACVNTFFLLKELMDFTY